MSLNAPNHFQYSLELPSRVSSHERRSAPTQNARPVPVTTDDADVVVPRRVLAGPCDLPEHPEVEGVEDVRPVQADRGAGRCLLVDDRLETELGRVARTWVGRLGHATGAAYSVPP